MLQVIIDSSYLKMQEILLFPSTSLILNCQFSAIIAIKMRLLLAWSLISPMICFVLFCFYAFYFIIFYF